MIFKNNELLEYKHDGKSYSVTIIKKPIKNMYLKVKKDQVVAVVNRFTSMKTIKQFVDMNIQKMIEYIENKKTNLRFSFENKFIYLNGKKYNIKIMDGNSMTKVSLFESDMIVATSIFDEEKISKSIFGFMKKSLHEFIMKTQPEYEDILKIPKHTFAIRNKNTTWGTNYFEKRNIIYSLNLAHYRDELKTYVILHELCHAIYRDHQSGFHMLMKEIMPNYRELSKELRSDKPII